MPSLYYYVNIFLFLSSIVFCLLSRDIYLFLGISFSRSFVTVSELFWSEIFDIFVSLSEILLPIKWVVASAVFWIDLFETF